MSVAVYTAGDRARQVSLHEASHGAVARALGNRNIVLTVSDDPWDGGSCWLELREGPDWFERRLVVLIAGRVAEWLEGGYDRLASDLLWQEARDVLRRECWPRPNAYSWALGHVRRSCPDDAESVLDALAVDALRRAVGLVLDNWPAIQRIADELQARGEIRI
jgi:hypothetical protein